MRNYTDSEMSWLAENVPKMDWKTITAEFNRVFDKQKSLCTLKTHCNRHGIYAKGMSQEGQSWNALPIGNEITNARGYTKVKTEKGYETKQRVVYKQHYGEIPQGYEVVFLDKDTQNFDIDNLFLVKRKTISTMRIIKRWEKWFNTTDPQLNKAMWTWLELYVAMRESEQE